jgi:hypothetical protein
LARLQGDSSDVEPGDLRYPNGIKFGGIELPRDSADRLGEESVAKVGTISANGDPEIGNIIAEG